MLIRGQTPIRVDPWLALPVFIRGRDRAYYALVDTFHFSTRLSDAIGPLRSGTAFVLGAFVIALGPRLLATYAPPAQRSSATEVSDTDGHPLNPFEPAGAASVIFFVATDCPISNSYAPEIQRVCREYATARCGLLADVRGRGHWRRRAAARRRGAQASAGVSIHGHSRGDRPFAGDRETRQGDGDAAGRGDRSMPARSGIAAESTTSMRRLGSRGSR